MAEEYQQPQLHHPQWAEEEGDKREYHGESKNSTLFASSGDEVANIEDSKDRGLFEHKVGDEAVTESVKFDSSDDVVATERGLFGSFMGKKEEEVKKVDENEVATELEKLNVLEPEETKVKEEKKLSRSGSSSSSSSSDEEEKGENGEKKKKKKGLKEKIKEMVSGEEDKTEEEKDVETPNEKPQKVAYEEPFEEAYEEPVADQAELENRVMDKTANTEDSLPKINNQEPEQKGKKGILEKIKEKIPGYNAKTT